MLLVGYLGPTAAIGGLVVAWASGIVWLLKKRQEEPAWDRSLPSGRREHRRRGVSWRHGDLPSPSRD
jgi:hypothetical protein